jgi:hypothetical protein
VSTQCTHLGQVHDVQPAADGCVECLASGDSWLHLRVCMSCGFVGCCDSSPHQHASAHARSSGHAVVQSFEPDEDWYWCYVDEVAFVLRGAPVLSHSGHGSRF